MSWQQTLENLRSKPDHIRKQYAFWTSFSITALIFAFWIGSFTSTGISSHSQVAATVEKVGTPGQTMVASVGSFFTDIKDLIFGPKKVTFSSVEVRPGTK